MLRFTRSLFKTLLTCIAISATAAAFAQAANVSLRWDANNPAPDGYRVFVRESGQSYRYDRPLWENNLTTCTLTGLTEGVTYHFVVRAFEGDLESADSEEIAYTPAVVVPNMVPTADAGQNQVVYEGQSVVLDGSNSNDPDGTISAYNWEQTAGNNISIANAGHVQASFVAPVVKSNGQALTFQLTVTDDDESRSTSNTTVSVLKSSDTDVDGDNVPDVLDPFPDDCNEWVDSDGDGIGNNQDADDDDDGMTDVWELTYGLDPLTDDSALDSDGDGITNLAEFQAATNPIAVPGNMAPEAPIIDTAIQTERVGLTPVLTTGAYFDIDLDDHVQSQWQISTDSDFSTLILEETSQTQLTAFTVGEMVLDTDTVYYWRVKFIDARNGTSDWSVTASFTTIVSGQSNDANVDGVPDAQEVDESVDVDEDGVPDCHEDNLMSIQTVEGQTTIGVETLSENVSLVALKSLPAETIPDHSVKMEFGLIGFKLYLQNGVTTASVNIHFSKPVAPDAKLFKYTADNGWQVYDHATFSPNRRFVTMMLEDGGVGDEDGIKNGVIVDPTGIANAATVTEIATSDNSVVSTGQASGGGGGCFISAGSNDMQASSSSDTSAAKWLVVVVVMMLLAGGVIFAAVFQENKKQQMLLKVLLSEGQRFK